MAAENTTREAREAALVADINRIAAELDAALAEESRLEKLQQQNRRLKQEGEN